MPVIYRCARCGAVLYTFRRAGQDYFGLPSPTELGMRLGRCPRCGHVISRPRLTDITIRVRGRGKGL